MAGADRLIEVFNEAKVRPVGPEHDGFLAQACRDDAELKIQILSLAIRRKCFPRGAIQISLGASTC